MLLLIIALWTNVVVGTLQQLSLGDTYDLQTCSIIESQLPGRVSFRQSDTYISQTHSYWATNQGELLSSCRISPRSSEDLQHIMSLISQIGTTFAVKSGGHSVVANTSNIDGGVVLDLELLNHVTVDADIGILDVGVGARWKEVYQKLDGSGYGVTGARSGSVGIGGYLLGGGLSPFSSIAGWACDSVVSFEVALADGTLLDVSHDNHADLFVALKGGGSNFGVVTRARLQLLKDQDKLDIACLQYAQKQLPEINRAIVQYSARADHDTGATVSISVGGPLNGRPIGVTVTLTHTCNISASGILSPFFEIPHQLGKHGVLSQLELGRFYDEMNPKAYRQYRTTTTVRNDADTLNLIVNDYVSNVYVNLSRLNDHDMQGGLLIQPLVCPHLRSGRIANRNIIGLQDEQSPLLLLSTEARWSRPGTDFLVDKILSDFIAATDGNAARRNTSHSFRYLNYASAEQLPFKHAEQCPELWSDILAVKQRYDPHNAFGRQMSHPFRITPES